MIRSMTGFAAVTREREPVTLQVDVRSVNHRYLDVQFKLPDELRGAEAAMRDLVSAHLSRGKVECRIGVTRSAASAAEVKLNVERVAQLRRLQTQARARFSDLAPMTVAEVLRWPGVLESRELPPEELAETVLAALATAIGEFDASRAREGEKLKAILLDRVARMEQLAGEVGPLIPELKRNFEEKLAARLTQALGSADDERVRQEVVLFAAKIDVDEELTRLAGHLGEVRRVLDAGGPCGKRLDFLMQELNREANTLGSKSALPEVSRIAVELKVLIEQMREQVQNLE